MKTKKNRSRKNRSRKNKKIKGGVFGNFINSVEKHLEVDKKYKCINCNRPNICVICFEKADRSNAAKLCENRHYAHIKCYCDKDTDTKIMKEKKQLLRNRKCPGCSRILEDNRGTIQMDIVCDYGHYER